MRPSIPVFPRLRGTDADCRPTHPSDTQREITMKYTVEGIQPSTAGKKYNFNADYILEDPRQEAGYHISEGQSLFCLNLFETDDGWQYSLVLNRPDPSRNQYERIGMVSLSGYNLYEDATQLSRVDLV
jgi:hypothetical protein